MEPGYAVSKLVSDACGHKKGSLVASKPNHNTEVALGFTQGYRVFEQIKNNV